MKLAERVLLTACQAEGDILRPRGHISFAPSLKQHLEALSRHPLGAHLAQGTCSGEVTAAIQVFPSIPSQITAGCVTGVGRWRIGAIPNHFPFRGMGTLGAGHNKDSSSKGVPKPTV